MMADEPTNIKAKQGGNLKSPEFAPEGKIGITDEEKEWAVKKPPRPRVPRYVFAGVMVCLFLSGIVSATWYYRKNILPEKYYMKAAAQFEAGNYGDAFTLYEKVAKIQPARRDVHQNMARSMVKIGDNEKAARYYEIHIQRQPEDADAKWEAAELYAEMQDYGRALELMTSIHLTDSERLQRKAEILLQAERKDDAAEALRDSALAGADPEKTLAVARWLMNHGFYEHALEAYKKTSGLVPEDNRGMHGANAAKKMLGLPVDTAMTIKPGESLGLVKLGSDKNEVKEAMGAPEEKAFAKTDRYSAEIWRYGKNNKNRSMAILFVGNRVKEIEARYSEFKTEDGLGIGNFMLGKKSDMIEKRIKLSDEHTRFDVKGGGITFYASGINESGDSAKYAKLLVHRKGEKPLGESLPQWFRLPW